VRQLIREQHDGKGPFFIAEWYPAWFDWWGEPHHKVPAARYTGRLDSVLAAGISINMYMFHGGSTRGFMNGANYNDKNPYEPQISSYDYDAPLDEAGNPTEKFMRFREVIERHLPAGQHLPAVPAAKPSMAIPSISLTDGALLTSIASNPVRYASPLSFENLSQDYGFVLYRTQLTGGRSALLQLKDLRDYAVVMVNGSRVGVMDRRLRQDSILLQLPEGKVQLDILVENLGRINFGPYLLKNRKGITDKVLFGGEELKGWEMYGLPFRSAPAIAYPGGMSKITGPPHALPASVDAPVIRRGSFNLTEVSDTYLDMRQWGKGVVWINGHNLGRYWSVGPQQTLYVPAEWLNKGRNEVLVLELLQTNMTTLSAIDKPILDTGK
jgi:beta-galactosidase